MADDPFAGAIASEARLRELYEQPLERAVRQAARPARRDGAAADRASRRSCSWRATTPTAAATSRRAAGQPGFVTVLDDAPRRDPRRDRQQPARHARATSSPPATPALLFLIPGRDQTLRVNGAACVTADPALLDRLTPVGKPPRTRSSCAPTRSSPTARRRSCARRLWDPRHVAQPPTTSPRPPRSRYAHLRDPALTVDDVERQQAGELRARVWHEGVRLLRDPAAEKARDQARAAGLPSSTRHRRSKIRARRAAGGNHSASHDAARAARPGRRVLRRAEIARTAPAETRGGAQSRRVRCGSPGRSGRRRSTPTSPRTSCASWGSRPAWST